MSNSDPEFNRKPLTLRKTCISLKMSKYGVFKKIKDSCLVSQFLWAATQGTPLTTLLWCQHGLYSWVPWECNNQRDNYWQANSPRTMYAQQIEATRQCSVETSLLVLDFGLRGRHSEVLARNVDQGMPSLCSLYLAPAHWYLPETNLCISLAP